MFDTDDQKREELMNIAKKIAKESDGIIFLVFNEEDESKEYTPEAGHFLKLNEKRIGRDIELYRFMGKVIGWEATVADFATLLFDIKPFCKKSYEEAKEMLCSLGKSVYDSETHKKFCELFE